MQPIFLPSTSPIFMQSLKTKEQESELRTSFLGANTVCSFREKKKKKELSETRGNLQVAVQRKAQQNRGGAPGSVSLGEAGEGGGQTLLSTSVAENFTAGWGWGLAPGRGGVKVCYSTPLTWGEKDLLSLAISSENEALILKTPCV